jgi:hypothetical protein
MGPGRLLNSGMNLSSGERASADGGSREPPRRGWASGGPGHLQFCFSFKNSLAVERYLLSMM